MIAEAALNVGDPTVPDWLAAIGTVGTLFLGLVLLWRDAGERRRQRQWERGAQARSIHLGAPKAKGQGTVDARGWISVSYEVVLLNDGDDAVHSVQLWLCILPSSVVRGDIAHIGSGSEPSMSSIYRDVLAAHESMTLRIAPKIVWDQGRRGPAPHLFVPRAEFTDMAGQRWERDDSLRLNLLRDAPRHSWFADKWEGIRLTVAVWLDRLRRRLRYLF
jgi:hypothetical protein